MFGGNHHGPFDKLHLPRKGHDNRDKDGDLNNNAITTPPSEAEDKDDHDRHGSHFSAARDRLHLPWKHHHGRHDQEDMDTSQSAISPTAAHASEQQPLLTPLPSTGNSTPQGEHDKLKSSPSPQKEQHYGSVDEPAAADDHHHDDGHSDTTQASVMKVWDVKMPPAKKTMVHGVLLPTVAGTLGSHLSQRKRRITIQVYSQQDEHHGEKAATGTAISPSLLEPKHEHDVLHEGERIVVRILKPTVKDNDDSSTSSEEGEGHGHSHRGKLSRVLGFHAHDDNVDADGVDDWKTRYVLGLDDVQVLKARDSHCEIKMGHGSDTQVRHIIFVNESEAASFQQVLEKLREMKTRFTDQQVKDFRRHCPPMISNQGVRIQILVEIVSGVGLPIADLTSTDPYVIVRLGGSQEVHRTLPIYSTVNPIWTLQSGSLFVLSVTPEEFFGSSQGLCFIVKDYDMGMNKNDLLGKVFVSQDELLNGDGKRKEFELMESFSDDPKRPGKLALRFRVATDQDVAFMERFASAEKSHVSGGVYGDETFVHPHVSNGHFMHREHRKVGGSTQHRVKPGPDPSRPESVTKWMTEAEIDAESQKPSSRWIEAGSGDIGKLFVEVIACEGLPNMDTQAVGGGKTDAFAAIVYEDCIVSTEVINDTLSPRWMPWTQRAFIFNVMHPSSQLMVGVLDFDSPAPMAKHDPIGRVSVDVTNLRPGTEYMLVFDLFTSAIVKKRKSKGLIKLRIRLELPNERKAIMAGLQPPPQIYVNVANYRDYSVANFVVEGKYNVHVFNMDLFAEYVEELRETGFALVPILKEAAFTVLMWRGHHPLTLRVLRCPPLPNTEDVTFWWRYTKNVTLLLPIHSLVAFIAGVLLVEDYNLFPSFLLFGVAWLFLATSGHIDDHPSPWHHPRSFVELMRALVGNSSPKETIEPHQNEEAIQEYVAAKEQAERKQKEAAERKAKEQQEERDAMGGLGTSDSRDDEVNMQSPTSRFTNISVNPLKPILYPMQVNLRLGCCVVRTVRSFLVWEESFYAFWIVILSICGGLLFLFVPWGFLVRWALRITVWGLLGPWMKLVDLFYVKRIASPEEQEKEAEARAKAKYEALLADALDIQTRREDLIKLKDMKRYMFGEYLAVLPRFKEERWFDIPLGASYAAPHVATESCKYDIISRKYGQHLTGDMIPRREIDERTKDSSSIVHS